MPTEMELTLEQTQQGVSYEVSRERRAHVATNARQSKGKLHGIFSSTSFSPQVEQFWIRAKHINERKDRRVIVQNDASTMRERDNSRVHSEQSESVYDTYLLEKVDRNTTPKSTDMSHRGGEIDQNADAKKCQVSCPLPDSSFDNMTTEFSNQSLNSDSGKGFFECRELKGNSVDTKFTKPSILGKHVLQPPRNQSVVRQPNAFKSERPNFLKPRFPSQVDVNNVLSKPVTPHYLPKVRESVFAKPQHVITPGLSRNSSKESYGSNDMANNYYLEEAKKKTQDKNRNLKPREMPSAKTHNIRNACTPKPRSNNQTSRNWPASKRQAVDYFDQHPVLHDNGKVEAILKMCWTEERSRLTNFLNERRFWELRKFVGGRLYEGDLRLRQKNHMILSYDVLIIQDCDGIPKRPAMFLNLWRYKVVRHRYSNPMIQPEPEGSTQGYPLVSVEVLRFNTTAGNPVKKILLKLNLSDHRILKDGGEVKEFQRSFRHSDTERLSRSDEVLKLKNFKKDATLKLSKSTNQEWYEHVGPEVTSYTRWQDSLR
ncbi:hypothetical protein Tco_0760303 [Tanacetum coccineum]